MSEYFRVLKRIEAEQRPPADARAPRPLRLAASKRSGVDAIGAAAAGNEPPTTAPIPPVQPKSFALLFDNLRALGGGRLPRSLVVVGASEADRAETIVQGLADHARSAGLEVRTAGMGTPFGATEREPHATPTIRAEDAEQDILAARGGADLLLVAGTSLSNSIDSALVGKSCDGLILVASIRATTQLALATAAERARSVGCRVLGLVADHALDDTPEVVSRFIAKLPGSRTE